MTASNNGRNPMSLIDPRSSVRQRQAASRKTLLRGEPDSYVRLETSEEGKGLERAQDASRTVIDSCASPITVRIEGRPFDQRPEAAGTQTEEHTVAVLEPTAETPEEEPGALVPVPEAETQLEPLPEP